MVNNAAFSIQSAFVKDIVLAHYNIFAPMVYCIEVFAASGYWEFLRGWALRWAH